MYCEVWKYLYFFVYIHAYTHIYIYVYMYIYSYTNLYAFTAHTHTSNIFFGGPQFQAVTFMAPGLESTSYLVYRQNKIQDDVARCCTMLHGTELAVQVAVQVAHPVHVKAFEVYNRMYFFGRIHASSLLEGAAQCCTDTNARQRCGLKGWLLSSAKASQAKMSQQDPKRPNGHWIEMTWTWNDSKWLEMTRNDSKWPHDFSIFSHWRSTRRVAPRWRQSAKEICFTAGFPGANWSYLWQRCLSWYLVAHMAFEAAEVICSLPPFATYCKSVGLSLSQAMSSSFHLTFLFSEQCACVPES